MSLEDNKALVRYSFDAIWNQGIIALVDQCVSPDWIAHGNLDKRCHALKGIRRLVTIYRTAFPDMHMLRLRIRLQHAGLHRSPILALS